MQLELFARVPAPTLVAWRHLTEPDLMNRWSQAKISLIETGDEGRADGVGALRSVRVTGARLLEVIQEAEVGRRFVYRVVQNPAIQSHRGTIGFRAQGDHTEVSWSVDAALSVKGAELLVKPLLERALRDSLSVLERGAELVSPATPARALYDDPGPELWSEAEEILRVQRDLATQMEQTDEPKRWFTRVYAYVTENMINHVRAGYAKHPAWVLRLIPIFHRIYLWNVRAHDAGRPCELQWREAFGAMEGKRGKRRNDPHYRIGYGLYKAVRAHIDEDLPRTLAEVWAQHYSDRCDYSRFRGDYLTMSSILADANRRLADDFPPGMIPWYAKRLPQTLEDAWQRRNGVDVDRWRMKAFERGGRIAKMLTRTDPLPGSTSDVSL